MKFLALATIFCGLAMAVPLADPVVARAVTSVKSSSIVKSSVKTSSTGALLAVNVGGSSSPLLGVNVGTATVVAVNVGSSVKASSASIKVSHCHLGQDRFNGRLVRQGRSYHHHGCTLEHLSGSDGSTIYLFSSRSRPGYTFAQQPACHACCH
jgi:hypothetical protein